MELLIAVLITLGAITGTDAQKLTNQNDINKLIQSKSITQKQIDETIKIIEMEDADM
jgi:hypothetical protein